MIRLLQTALLFVLTWAGSAAAQSPTWAPRRARVILELDPTAAHADTALLVRARGRQGAGRIVLPASASPRLLVTGVLALASIMEREGDVATQASLTKIGVLPKVPVDEERAAASVLNRLRAQGNGATARTTL